jgi:hypothetical protein
MHLMENETTYAKSNLVNTYTVRRGWIHGQCIQIKFHNKLKYNIKLLTPKKKTWNYKTFLEINKNLNYKPDWQVKEHGIAF